MRLNFSIWLLLSLVLFAPVPFLLYRTYGLIQAGYTIDRNGLRIRWGLRSEDIPLPEIEWVRPADEMGLQLPLPFIKWPGSILGTKFSADLGNIEYIGSDRTKILLIATPQKIYAISPGDTKNFLRAFQIAIEMGSLSPLNSYSTRPAAFLQNIWKDNFARSFILASLVLTIGLFISTSLLISSRTSLSMGYDLSGQSLPAGPSEHVFLLPVLGVFTFIMDTLAGMYFYRRIESRFHLLSYLGQRLDHPYLTSTRGLLNDMNYFNISTSSWYFSGVNYFYFGKTCPGSQHQRSLGCRNIGYHHLRAWRIGLGNSDDCLFCILQRPL